MTHTDLDSILRDLQEATKRAEAALAAKGSENTSTAPDALFEHIGWQMNKSSDDLANEFLADDNFGPRTTTTNPQEDQ